MNEEGLEMGKFPFGASYSPLMFSKQEWERDLALMQQAGMNLIRAGDVHGSWDRLEPQEDEYAFQALGQFYEQAHAHGMDILLSNGAACPPLWLVHNDPDVLLLSNTGERYPIGASYHWACIHHPRYREALEKYSRKLAEFTTQHPNHFGWQITNEIGFPFLPTRGNPQLGLYCYCSYCQEKFRGWVKDKYHDLAALTEAWAWGTSNFVYNSWQEISPPETTPSSWSGVTRWIDWRTFWQEAFAHFAGWQHRILKEVDPDHPTSINTFNFKGYDRFGSYMGLDQWKIAQQVDHIGYDLYPGSGNKLATRPEHSSIFLDHGRSVSQSAGSAFWIHEIESGPINGWLMGPDRNTDARDVLNYTVESLGHNGKVLLYMPWKEWAYQPLRWGALVDLDSHPTPRYNALIPFGNLLQNNAAFLNEAQTPPSQVAIVESKANALFIRGTDDEELLFQAQRGAYRAFWEKGFGVDFIPDIHLSQAELGHYSHIVLPLLGLLSTADADILAEYVHQGGILIGFSRLATLDRKGWFHHQLPIPGLKKVFGMENIQADTFPGETIHFQGREYPPFQNRDLLTIPDEVQVLGRFDDAKPAVTLHAHGGGWGVYIATQADGAYVHPSGNNLLSDVIEDINNRVGISPPYTMRGSGNRATMIDPHFLETEDQTWLLFSNYHPEKQVIEFSFPVQDRSVQSLREIFPDQNPIPYSTKKDLLSLEKLLFNPKEVKIIEVTWQ
jgi:beta-galactosidase GanA